MDTGENQTIAHPRRSKSSLEYFWGGLDLISSKLASEVSQDRYVDSTSTTHVENAKDQ